jgi:hypothetical protein
LTISHQVRESIRYVLDVGHESSLGVQSDLTEDWYVRPSINWSFIKDWNFNTGLFYQHGKQGLGSQFIGPGNLNQSENYDWYGGNLSLSRAITSRLTLSLDYRLTVRSSNRADNSYTQNLVGLRLTYHPQ